MIQINVEVNYKHWFKKIKNPKNYIKPKLKIVASVIPFFKKKNVILTILLTNSKSVKKLNKKFRNKNQPTDVLSFPYFRSNDLKSMKENKIYIGDLAVSYEIIKKRSIKNNFKFEFDKVWIHGLLHLIGYDHIKNKDYFIMEKVEKKILNLISN
jgi:probable rRNA maturation factor